MLHPAIFPPVVVIAPVRFTLLAVILPSAVHFKFLLVNVPSAKFKKEPTEPAT